MIKLKEEMKVEVRENMRGADGSVTIQHYFTQDEIKADTRLCAKLTLPPGSGIGKHEHDGEDEVFIVIKGSGIIEDGDNKSRVNAGDAILTGNGGAHSVYNDTDQDLEMVAVIMCY